MNSAPKIRRTSTKKYSSTKTLVTKTSLSFTSTTTKKAPGMSRSKRPSQKSGSKMVLTKKKKLESSSQREISSQDRGAKRGMETETIEVAEGVAMTEGAATEEEGEEEAAEETVEIVEIERKGVGVAEAEEEETEMEERVGSVEEEETEMKKGRKKAMWTKRLERLHQTKWKLSKRSSSKKKVFITLFRALHSQRSRESRFVAWKLQKQA